MRLILLSLALLASCASRQQVHVFNEGYSDGDIAAVLTALRDSGFEPRRNELEVPEGIRTSSIIYPPIVQEFETVALLQDTLARLGHESVELIYETRSEHFYSTENIGLYLVNPDYDPPEAQAESPDRNEGPILSRIYYSNCDEVDAELSLLGQDTAILEIVEWNENTDRERATLFDGQWSRTESTVEFELFDGGRILFEYNEFDGRDDYGRFYGIDLISTANSSDLTSCDFRFITYDLRTTLNRI